MLCQRATDMANLHGVSRRLHEAHECMLQGLRSATRGRAQETQENLHRLHEGRRQTGGEERQRRRESLHGLQSEVGDFRSKTQAAMAELASDLREGARLWQQRLGRQMPREETPQPQPRGTGARTRTSRSRPGSNR